MGNYFFTQRPPLDLYRLDAAPLQYALGQTSYLLLAQANEADHNLGLVGLFLPSSNSSFSIKSSSVFFLMLNRLNP
jgi:hypothetical protein